MVEVTATIDEAALSNLEGLLNAIARQAPKRLATETRRAAIYICQSLRRNTKEAKKTIRAYPAEYAANISYLPPKYVHSNSAHHKLLRRWTLARKLGTTAAYAKHYYVYTDRHRVKGGKMQGGSLAAERRELLRLHGGIQNHGLAKKSWGWTMHQISASAAAGDLSWKRKRGEVRDPREAVRGVFRQSTDGAFALISNKLDYILDAVPPAALNAAITAATKRLEHNVAALLEDDRPSHAATYSWGPGSDMTGTASTPWWKAYARGRMDI